VNAVDVCLPKWSSLATVDAIITSNIVEAMAMMESFHQSLPLNDELTMEEKTKHGEKICRTMLEKDSVSVPVTLRKANPIPMTMKIGKMIVSRICTIMLKKSDLAALLSRM